MPLVSMRQLLDHAAENGYGIPAFNVNNLEQVQAVMAAADEVGAPVILQASAGARKYAGEPFIKHLIEAALESYPEVPLVMHQDHGQSPDVCRGAIELGFSLGDDGRLAARPTARRSPATTTTSTSRARSSTWRTSSASPSRANSAAWARWRPCAATRKTATAPKSTMTTRAAADRPRAGRRLRQEDPARRAGDRHRHQPRRLQVHPQAHRRHPGHRPHQGDSQAHPEHAPGDARLLQRAAGPAGR